MAWSAFVRLHMKPAPWHPKARDSKRCHITAHAVSCGGGASPRVTAPSIGSSPNTSARVMEDCVLPVAVGHLRPPSVDVTWSCSRFILWGSPGSKAWRQTRTEGPRAVRLAVEWLLVASCDVTWRRVTRAGTRPIAADAMRSNHIR